MLILPKLTPAGFSGGCTGRKCCSPSVLLVNYVPVPEKLIVCPVAMATSCSGKLDSLTLSQFPLFPIIPLLLNYYRLILCLSLFLYCGYLYLCLSPSLLSGKLKLQNSSSVFAGPRRNSWHRW